MKLASPGRPHLTYCTNIHPGETWEEVRNNIEDYVLAVKSQVAPDRPFGIGLRLSSQAAEELSRPDTLEAFGNFLHANNLYVFTINGFPYGRFHGQHVKERVYLPDWLDERRLVYTNRLAQLLAGLLPTGWGLEDFDGSISTVPGAFRACVTREAEIERMVDLLLRHLVELHHLRERTGRLISLALEPEPCCWLETVDETIAFFESRLFSQRTITRFSALTGLPRGAVETFLRRHVGVCFDACHMAVEFEDPEAAIHAFQTAGIRIGKIQLSAGLKVTFDGDTSERLRLLKHFDDGIYLHQVVERQAERLTRHVDLPEARQSIFNRERPPDEWRIHFHVPLHAAPGAPFSDTRDHLLGALDWLKANPRACQHLEMETYTWEVMPPELKNRDVVDQLVSEYDWTLARLAERGLAAATM